ncbi:hypothetical protein ACFX1S_014952 [Malus domestica]
MNKSDPARDLDKDDVVKAAEATVKATEIAVDEASAPLTSGGDDRAAVLDPRDGEYSGGAADWEFGVVLVIAHAALRKTNDLLMDEENSALLTAPASSSASSSCNCSIVSPIAPPPSSLLRSLQIPQPIIEIYTKKIIMGWWIKDGEQPHGRSKVSCGAWALCAERKKKL